MFGFSLAKLMVLVAVIAAVWYGFKFLGRVGRVREANQNRRRVRETDEERAEADVQATIKCPKCGAYVPARQPTACERADCPYP